MKINIIIKLQFSALHCWPDCDVDGVLYLRNLHRHMFHVTMKFPVTHSDRDIEFIGMKNKVHKFIQRNWEGEDLGPWSCEMIAGILLKRFPPCSYVSVFEDDENGAEIQIDI